MAMRKLDIRPEIREGEVVMARSLGWITTELGLTDILVQWIWRDGNLARRVVLGQTANEAELVDCIELLPHEGRLLAMHLGEAAMKWIDEDLSC